MFHDRNDRVATLPIVSHWAPGNSAGELQIDFFLTSNALTPLGGSPRPTRLPKAPATAWSRGRQKFNGADFYDLIANISTCQSGIPDVTQRKTPKTAHDFFVVSHPNLPDGHNLRISRGICLAISK